MWHETLTKLVESGAFPGAVHRILLYGPPGTGKSTYGTTLGLPFSRIELFRKQEYTDLVGTMMPSNDNGVMTLRFSAGPAVSAMMAGKLLIVDEIDKLSEDCQTAFHSMADDLAIAQITTPVGVVKPKPGYGIIATTNESPGKLPAAIRDRFDVQLYCGTPAPGIQRGWKYPAMGRIMDDLYQSQTQYVRPMSIRAMLCIQRLAETLDIETACRIVFGAAGADLASTLLASVDSE